MKEVDYGKLSEQYASFLVAIGGVSITVLALVLTFGSEAGAAPDLAEVLNPGSPVLIAITAIRDLRAFLITALVVGTVSCFIGAHMMAETAAFISHSKGKLPKDKPPAETPLGERLFLLATTNIFIAIVLVLFALMLLPTASAKIEAGSITLISITIFVLVVGGAFIWVVLAGMYRMPVTGGRRVIGLTAIIGVLWAAVLYLLHLSNMGLLLTTFIPIVVFTVTSFLYFALIFKDGSQARHPKVCVQDIGFFSITITLSYTSLVFSGFRLLISRPISKTSLVENYMSTTDAILICGIVSGVVGVASALAVNHFYIKKEREHKLDTLKTFLADKTLNEFNFIFKDNGDVQQLLDNYRKTKSEADLAELSEAICSHLKSDVAKAGAGFSLKSRNVDLSVE